MIMGFWPEDFTTDILIQMFFTHSNVPGKPRLKRLKMLIGIPAYWLFPIHPLEFTQEDQDDFDLLYFPCHRRVAILRSPAQAEGYAKVAKEFFGEPEAF